MNKASVLPSESAESSGLKSELAAKIHLANDLKYALVYEGTSKQREKNGETLIVLIPGVPGSELDFCYLAPLVYKWAPVVRIVLPGFGVLTDETNSPASAIARAQYLKSVADAEQWKSLLILGHSMGGISCIYWASIDQRVRSLALLCSVGVQAHKGMAFGAHTAYFLWLCTYLPIIGKSLLKIFRKAMIRMGFKKHKLDEHQLRLILRHVIHLNFTDVKKHLSQTHLAKVDQIGVFYCFDDQIVELNASEALIKHLENNELNQKLIKRCLEKGGHNPQKHRRSEVDQWLHTLYNVYIQ